MIQGPSALTAVSEHNSPAESQYFSLPIHFLDEDDDHNGSQLVEVSEGTYRLLKTYA